jgi:hypothetical protein
MSKRLGHMERLAHLSFFFKKKAAPLSFVNKKSLLKNPLLVSLVPHHLILEISGGLNNCRVSRVF